MKKALCLLYLVISTLVYSLEGSDYISEISAEDSLTIISLRNSMARNLIPNSDFYFSKKINELFIQKNYSISSIESVYIIGAYSKIIQQKITIPQTKT
jgi:hypothetical protein